MRLILLSLGLGLLPLVAGCGSGTSSSSTVTVGSGDDEVEFSSPEEKKYSVWSKPFGEMYAKADHDGMYELCSSHLKKRWTKSQFAEEIGKLHRKFGKPRKCDPYGGVDTEKEMLAGPKNQKAGPEQGINQMLSARTVGNCPDSVPPAERKAAVCIGMETDPETASDQDAESRKHFKEIGEGPRAYLNLILVEEDGGPKVAHVFVRWHDMGD
jgi:hypothetical protein